MDKDIIGSFTDAATWDGETKTAISVRDGVLEYLGSELGEEPADKMFTIYRSPATIANVASGMNGIPLTDDHVDVGSEVSVSIGSVVDAMMVDMIDNTTNSKLAIQNSINVSDSFLTALTDGNRELSLGYDARLVPHAEYDFEQRDIKPHHLAVVSAGRCGHECRFIDRSPKEIIVKIHKVFADAEGAPNLEQIVEIAQALPEALKSIPVDKLQEVLPMLQELVAMAGGKTEELEAPPAGEEPPMDEAPPEDIEAEDAGGEGKDPKDEKKPIMDTAEFKDALAVAVKSAVADRTTTLVKSMEFLAEDYSFEDKSTVEIQRDALATIHGKTEFKDSELSIAFKMLKNPATNVSRFGDAAADGKFSQLQDKEL